MFVSHLLVLRGRRRRRFVQETNHCVLWGCHFLAPTARLSCSDARTPSPRGRSPCRRKETFGYSHFPSLHPSTATKGGKSHRSLRGISLGRIKPPWGLFPKGEGRSNTACGGVALGWTEPPGQGEGKQEGWTILRTRPACSHGTAAVLTLLPVLTC